MNSTAQYRIDVDVKDRMLGQHLQLLVENFQAFFRDIIRLNVVDTDLQMLQPGVVQLLDAIRHQEIPVGDQSRDHAMAPDMRDQPVKLGMEQRFASAES